MCIYPLIFSARVFTIRLFHLLLRYFNKGSNFFRLASFQNTSPSLHHAVNFFFLLSRGAYRIHFDIVVHFRRLFYFRNFLQALTWPKRPSFQYLIFFQKKVYTVCAPKYPAFSLLRARLLSLFHKFVDFCL